MSLNWFYADDPKKSWYGSLNPKRFRPKSYPVCPECKRRSVTDPLDNICGTCAKFSLRSPKMRGVY